MNGNFKIELKDKTTGSVVKTVTVPAKITDYWKYESTYGFPAVDRHAHLKYLLTLPFSSAGIQLFENTLDLSRSKFRTKLSDTYIAYASRYNAAGNPEQYSSKAGHMSDYQLTTDFNQSSTVGGQVTYTLKWSWGASQGNGTFKSLGTLNAQGAHAKDTTPILQNGAESLSTVSAGQDFSVNCSVGQVSSGNPGAREVNVDSSNSVTMLDGSSLIKFNLDYIYSQKASAAASCAFYYQTNDNIIQLWFNTRNVLTQNNTYESEIRYRVISKSALHRFHLGQYNGLHPLNFNPDVYDSSFVINSGTHILVPLKCTADGTGTSISCKIENNGYFLLFAADSDTGNANPNPDGKTPIRHSAAPWYKMKTFVIKGDIPELIAFSSVYDSALAAFISDYPRTISSYAGFIFTSDFAYIYVDAQTSKLVKRYLSGDTFAWELSLNTPDRILLSFLDGESSAFGMCNYYRSLQYTMTGTTSVQFTLIDKSDPTIIQGYFMNPTANSNPYSDFVKQMSYICDYNVDNPFYLSTNLDLSGTPVYYSFAKTDALFAKANLPEPITKTSDYTLDITLTLNIY